MANASAFAATLLAQEADVAESRSLHLLALHRPDDDTPDGWEALLAAEYNRGMADGLWWAAGLLDEMAEASRRWWQR